MPRPTHYHKVRKYVRASMRQIIEAEDDPDHLATIYGYRRCSHLDSLESGLGLEAQLQRITCCTQMLLIDHPELQVAAPHEDHDDKVVSAWKIEFRDRPGARALLSVVQRGDHIVVAEMTRAFRNAKDCLNTIHYLQKRGIILHFADLGIDLSTPHGELMVTMLSAVAQWESRIKSERAKAIVAVSRRLGHVVGGIPQPGWRYTRARPRRAGEKGGVVAVPDPSQRAIMGLIVEWREEDGYSWREIADRVEEHLAAKQGREPYRRSSAGRTWGYCRCRRAYDNELEFRKNEEAQH